MARFCLRRRRKSAPKPQNPPHRSAGQDPIYLKPGLTPKHIANSNAGEAGRAGEGKPSAGSWTRNPTRSWTRKTTRWRTERGYAREGEAKGRWTPLRSELSSCSRPAAAGGRRSRRAPSAAASLVTRASSGMPRARADSLPDLTTRGALTRGKAVEGPKFPPLAEHQTGPSAYPGQIRPGPFHPGKRPGSRAFPLLPNGP